MSSRAMKKLLRDSNGPAPLKNEDDLGRNKENAEQAEEEEEEEDDDYVVRRPPARNLFVLLDEDDEQDDAESDNDEPKQEAITAAPVSSKKKKSKKKSKAANPFDALKDEEDSMVDNSQKSKNKGKKKKKGKAVKSVEEMSVEEFEKSLQQMNQQLGTISSGESSQKPLLAPLKQLLAVDTRFLDADAEMKKMFGARVVNSEIKDRRYAKVSKKALLAQPRGTWPVRKASGLSMEIVDTDKDNTTTFKIVHSDPYQRTQLKFLRAVASYDPNNLVALLRESPFHIDSLLQLSEVSKHNGDNGLAGEFIEQALFAFEKSFHSLFNIASGAVRLSFMEVENRSFFLAIHRHIQFLGRRGCWRTAFEFNKLLLSLDPVKDELGSLLSIDFYALKAQEFSYLIRLYERLQSDHALDRLPSFAYSIAMAKFHFETMEGKDHEESSKALQRAILLFPTAVPLLADQGGFSIDSEMAGEGSFYPAKDLPKILDLYINLFALRNFALWKEPEVIAWLKQNVKFCVQNRFGQSSDTEVRLAKTILSEISAASQKSPVLSYSADGQLETDQQEPKAGPWTVSLRICRHVLVSEFNTLARFLPQEIVTATMHMHDPLPPSGSRNIYEERFEAQQGAGGLMGGARDAAQNVLEEVVRRLRAAGVAGGDDVPAGEAQGLQEAQIRQITEAVQMLRARHAAGAPAPGALPGAFPGSEDEAAVAGADLAADETQGEGEGPGAPSMFRSLSDMMRLLGFGGRAGDHEDALPEDGAPGTEPPLPLTVDETNELAAMMAGLPRELLEGEDGEGEGSDGESDGSYEEMDEDDGWEPYDPAAYQ